MKDRLSYQTLLSQTPRRAAWRYGFIVAAGFLLAFNSCAPADHINGAGVSTAGARPPDEPVVEGQPLEHRPPAGTGQSPAFPGQTRAPAVVTRMAIEEKIVARGLPPLWALAFLSDGRILVTEKSGEMRLITMDGQVGDPIAGVPPVFYNADAGLFDVVLDPAFATNRLIYFSYAEPREGKNNGTTIAKARLSDDARQLENLTVILRVQPSLPQPVHYGCRLLFDGDGKLFVSLGERYFSPTRDAAQDLHSQMGKILRINPDGTSSVGNPFEKTPGALPEIWSYGHRNPQGLAFNPVTHELWETEHGPKGGDEVNVIQPGRNYGWPLIAYGTEYDGTPIDHGLTQKAGMEQPVYYWDPAIAPSGATFYDGDLIPEWKNNLFVCGLVGEHVSRLVIAGHKIVGEERLLLDQHQRMRDIRQGPDGALWLVTDDRGGDARLIRIGPARH